MPRQESIILSGGRRAREFLDHLWSFTHQECRECHVYRACLFAELLPLGLASRKLCATFLPGADSATAATSEN